MRDEQEHRTDLDPQVVRQLRAEFEAALQSSAQRDAASSVASRVRSRLESQPTLANPTKAATAGGAQNRRRARSSLATGGIALAIIATIAAIFVSSVWNSRQSSPSFASSPAPARPIASPAVITPRQELKTIAESPTVVSKDGADGKRGLQVVEAGFSGIFSAVDKSKSMFKPWAEVVAGGSEMGPEGPKSDKTQVASDEHLIVGLASNFLGRSQVFD